MVMMLSFSYIYFFPIRNKFFEFTFLFRDMAACYCQDSLEEDLDLLSRINPPTSSSVAFKEPSVDLGATGTSVVNELHTGHHVQALNFVRSCCSIRIQANLILVVLIFQKPKKCSKKCQVSIVFPIVFLIKRMRWLIPLFSVISPAFLSSVRQMSLFRLFRSRQMT
jgi:hypothetical protein